LFRINIKIKESLDNILVENIKITLILRPKLLKSLKLVIENYLKIKKTYFNITTIFKVYTLIIKTEGIKFYIVSLITGL